MSLQTDTKPKDISNTQSNGEKAHKSNYLINHEEIKNTPFHITNTEEGYMLRVGDYRLTDWMLTKKEVLEYLEKNMWHIIFRVIAVARYADEKGNI